jgi:hypothetical protein
MQGADTHVTVLPEFIVPEDRFQDFVAGFPKFYEATKVSSTRQQSSVLLSNLKLSGTPQVLRGKVSRSTQHSNLRRKLQDKFTDIVACVSSIFYKATNVISTQHLQPSVSIFYEEMKQRPVLRSNFNLRRNSRTNLRTL